MGGAVWLRRSVAASAALVLVAMLVIAGQIQFDWLGGALTTLCADRSDGGGGGLGFGAG